MSVRLYGRDVGNGSLAVVTRGFREVLEDEELLEGFYALDKSGGGEEEEQPAGALARDGVFTGNLNLLNHMRTGTRHERHWVTVTPNSNYVPHKLLDAVVKLPNPRILSASAWGTTMIGGALSELGFTYVEDDKAWLTYEAPGSTVQVHTVHHGVLGFAPVLSEIQKTRADYENGEFRVVHFSTTEGERKGTLELVQAWSLLRATGVLPNKTELLLVLDHHARAALQSRMIDHEVPMVTGIRILPRADMAAATMSRFLCGQHLVCCPSRAEGFGLLPLQARACGVPVSTTVTTGHSAGHCEGFEVCVIAQSDELHPIDDGPGAMAPRVTPVAIADAIRLSCARWLDMSRMSGARTGWIAEHWSWYVQLAPLMEQLR